MRPAIEILEDELDDIPTLTAAELGIPIDLTRADLEEEDDLGFRALFEHPEAVLRPSRWTRAA